MTGIGDWHPDGWWRVLAPDGSLWCETSDEQEARKSMRPGDQLEQHEQIIFVRWQQRYVKPPVRDELGVHRFACPARQRDVPCTCGADG